MGLNTKGFGLNRGWSPLRRGVRRGQGGVEGRTEGPPGGQMTQTCQALGGGRGGGGGALRH